MTMEVDPPQIRVSRRTLSRRQQELEKRDEKVLLFGEPEAKPMGYGRAPKFPAYNLQSVSTSTAASSSITTSPTKRMTANCSARWRWRQCRCLEVDQLSVLADGGYSNAHAIAERERDNVEVAAPIKRGAMDTDHFRPVQFAYDEASDTIRRPAGETLRPHDQQKRGPQAGLSYTTSMQKGGPPTGPFYEGAN
jgi:hypothetical protein